jgi:hypothetical protein
MVGAAIRLSNPLKCKTQNTVVPSRWVVLVVPYGPVPPYFWADLISIDQFSDADYIGPDQLPWPTGITAKRWFGFLYWSFSGLDVAGGVRKSFAYYRSAVGLGMNAEPQITPSYENEYAAFLFVGSLALGSVIIDNDGIEEVKYTE